EDLLEQLLGAVAVAGHAVQEGQQRRGVAAHQDLQAPGLVLGHALHQRLVALAFGAHRAPPGASGALGLPLPMRVWRRGRKKKRPAAPLARAAVTYTPY